jgi:transposase
MKRDRIAEDAARLYLDGKSIDDVAKELGVAYRTARAALLSVEGIEIRDPRTRLLGRTRPKTPRTRRK